MTLKTLVIAVVLITLYCASTWFVFGSVHPCEILVVRQKDHELVVAQSNDQKEMESWREMAGKFLPPADYERFVRNLQEYSNALVREENLQRVVVTNLRQKSRSLTPVECAWQAVTWKTPASVEVKPTL